MEAMRIFVSLWFLNALSLAVCRDNTRRRLAHRREQQRLSDNWIQKQRQGTIHPPTRRQKQGCPCPNEDLCEPVQGSPVRQRELFGFYYPGKGYPVDYINWTYVTTIAWASDDMLCHAHENGIRLIAAAPSGINLTLFSENHTSRDAWIDETVQMVQARFFDGITFDYENAMESSDSLDARTYVSLVNETKKRFGNISPHYQITVCVAWSPDGIDGRNFPARELADVADALYVMDYDTQSQIFDACLAGANAPYYGMIHGITRYLHCGVPAHKMILGVPWYGYRYPCLPGTGIQDRYCPLRPTPFRGVPCSDAAGSEHPFLSIQSVIRESGATVHRDVNMKAPYFNVLADDGTVVQYWFDDAASLQEKFAWAQSVGLRGVGPYSFVDLDPALDPQGSSDTLVAMWSAFDAFFVDDIYSS